MGGIVGLITGKTAKKAAKVQAAATLKAANDQAAADRVTAQGAQQARETLIAQDAASKSASALLSAPQDKLDVSVAADVPDAEIDPATGRKRSARASFQATGPARALQGAPSAGIVI